LLTDFLTNLVRGRTTLTNISHNFERTFINCDSC